MSEEIRLGKYNCKDGTLFKVTKVKGDSVIVVDGATMHFSRSEFGYLVAMQSAVHQSDTTHTFTDDELERLIAVACREQRYACVDRMLERPTEGLTGAIQNTDAPTLSHVMEKYKKEVKE